MSHEFAKKYRPKSLKDLVGQPEVVQVLTKYLRAKNLPHTLLLAGSSGAGKTTTARILRDELGCHGHDFQEINAAESRGIDTVRQIIATVSLAPMGGKCRIFLLDEAHHLTSRAGGDAQTALLKVLEDTPAHVYFFLATTHPQGLLPTLRGRCTLLSFRKLDEDELTSLIRSVIKKEKASVPDSVVEKIADVADGSARQALCLLDAVVGIGGEEDQLNAVRSSQSEHTAVELCRLLLAPGAKWVKVSAVLKSVEEDPEDLRRMVLGYSRQVLLGGGKLASRAYELIRCFEDPYFNSGAAGLAASCWEALHR